MRHLLMAAVAVSLALGQGGAVLAQSPTSGSQGQQAGSSRSGGSNQGSAELFYMLQQLQQELRELRGTVEEQGNQIDRLSSQARDRYIDLDQRILDLSGKLAEKRDVSPAGGSTETGGEPVVQKVYRSPEEAERNEYNQIQKLIREEKAYDEAISRLYDFIDKYPEGDLTVNAYYWLGEVYLVKPQLEQAKQAFTIVATRYRDHRKAPDAVYKLGVTLDRLDETEAARDRMQTVIQDYPDSNAAGLARKYLEEG